MEDPINKGNYFISTVDFGETSALHIKSKSVVIVTGYETDEIIE